MVALNLFYLESPKPPGGIYAVIEVPKGSKNKYEYNYRQGFMELDRVSNSSFVSPVNYGFVPRTWTRDDAPLDIMVLSQMPIYPGVVVEVYPIGYLDVVSLGMKDPKVLSVAKTDPQYNQIKDIKSVTPHFLDEVSHFFRRYRELEKRDIVVNAWHGPEAAEKIILDAFRDFEENF